MPEHIDSQFQPDRKRADDDDHQWKVQAFQDLDPIIRAGNAVRHESNLAEQWAAEQPIRQHLRLGQCIPEIPYRSQARALLLAERFLVTQVAKQHPSFDGTLAEAVRLYSEMVITNRKEKTPKKDDEPPGQDFGLDEQSLNVPRPTETFIAAGNHLRHESDPTKGSGALQAMRAHMTSATELLIVLLIVNVALDFGAALNFAKSQTDLAWIGLV